MAKFKTKILVYPRFSSYQKDGKEQLRRDIVGKIESEMSGSNEMLKHLHPDNSGAFHGFHLIIYPEQVEGEIKTADDVKKLLEILLEKAETLKSEHLLGNIETTIKIDASTSGDVNG